MLTRPYPVKRLSKNIASISILADQKEQKYVSRGCPYELSLKWNG